MRACVFFLVVCLLGGAIRVGAEEPRVASFHPLATDLARQIGGAAVTVVEVMQVGQDPHAFAPTPSDLQAAEGAALWLLMGKGLETYRDTLEENLQPGQQIFEIGRMIPSLRMEDDMALFACCPAHAFRAIDPHWWHSVRNMKRATRLLTDALADAFPQEADGFRVRAKAYTRQLDELEAWARAELDRVPQAHRRLTTPHAAFNYFCADYRFRAAPVIGLTSLDKHRPGQVRQVIDALVEEGVPAVFPEDKANPEMLKAIAQEAGITLGRPLFAGNPPAEDPTFAAMFRSNVTAIVEALAPAESAL